MNWTFFNTNFPLKLNTFIRKNKMITVRLKGGLGNQLFQYALGRNLALKHKTTLTLDVSSFKKDALRKYALDPFLLSQEVAIENCGPINSILNSLGGKSFFFRNLIEKRLHYINESQFEFDSKILNSPDNSVLDGYWQSEKYFNSIEGALKRDLTLKNPFSKPHQILLNEILTTNSISIHVRRGDYLTNPVTNAFHGLCSIEWYKQAVEMVKKIQRDPHFYIFSDDSEWAKHNLKPNGNVTYIANGGAGDEAYEMALMSRCKHNIIANSSFSWWAAWLNNNPAKLVLAPKKWFAIDSINTKDLTPDSWIKF